MTDDDVKAVARAFFDRSYNGPDDPTVTETLWGICMNDAQIAITTLQSLGWQRVPEGCVVVPREPTDDMVKVGYANQDNGGPGIVYRGIYRAMIAAGEVKS
jgi:hypothetical protein